MTDDTGSDGGDDGQSTRAAELTYDIDRDERPSMAAVRAVASLTDTAVLDLDPLYDVVDPEHLDGLASETRHATDERGGDVAIESRSVTFHYGGCRVTVTGAVVRVEVREP